MKDLLSKTLKRVPMVRTLSKYLPERFRSPSGSSSRYSVLDADEFAQEATRLRGAWQADELPARQRDLVDKQLAMFRGGGAIDVFDVMIKALRNLPESPNRMSLLEIGCSSGYYAQVLQVAAIGVSYAGCDYSPAFIALAREKCPGLRFDVGDACALRYANNDFDIVVSGCCLLHIPEYKQAMAETVRVAKRYCIFHRTPVVLGQPERRYRKTAYGVEMVEIHFNEPQFLALLIRNGLELIATYTLSETVSAGIGSAQRTYVCRKVSAP